MKSIRRFLCSSVLPLLVLTACTTDSTSPGANTPGSFSLTLSAGTLSAAQGGSASTVTATLTRTNGFAGNVAFNATGAPAGMTVTFSPASTTANATTITVLAAGTAATGTHVITIVATAAGVPAQTASLNVVVTSSAGAGGNGTYRVCANVVFAGFQDLNGPWTAAAVTNNSFNFNFPSGRGGVVFVTQLAANWFNTSFIYGSVAELNIAAAPCFPLTSKNLTGSVAGLGASDVAYVGMGFGVTLVNPAAPNFNVLSPSALPTDLIATRLTQTGSAAAFRQVATAAIVRRGVNAAAINTVGLLDFNGAEAVTPVLRNLTANNLGNDMLSVSESYTTSPAGGIARNAAAGILYIETPTSSSSRQFPTLPGPQSGDLHALVLTAAPAGPLVSNRNVFAYFTNGADKTFTFGPAIGTAAVTTVATSPSVRLRTQYAIQPEYNKALFLNYGQAAGTATRGISITMMTDFLTGLTTFDHTLPDLNALMGWNAAWGLTSAAEVQWSLAVSSFARGDIIDGTTFMIATRLGALTP